LKISDYKKDDGDKKTPKKVSNGIKKSVRLKEDDETDGISKNRVCSKLFLNKPEI